MQSSTRGVMSHRSGEDSQRNPPKSQRGSSKAKPKAKEPVAHGTAEAELKPMAEVLAPLLAAVDKLRGEIDELESLLASKRMSSTASLPAPTAPTAAVASVAAATTGGEADAKQKRTRALRVWQNFASEQLTSMASSLEAALACDEKLRRLFDKIDIDLGGTIDQQELHNALRAAGKKVTTETVAEMFHAADYDGGGDIDYGEFADVIKGLKASKAAFILERGVRRHQEAKKPKTPPLSGDELDAALSSTLLGTTSPEKIVADWDRSKKRGAVSITELRQGARFRFLLNFESKEVDDWFARFDKDGDGHLNLTEMKDMFRSVEAKMKSWRQEAARSGKKLEVLRRRVGALENAKRACEEALEESARADARLVEHRAKKHVSALVGHKLKSKIRSAENPKAVLSIEDVIAQWDIGRRRAGFMDFAEFTSLIGAAMGAGMSTLRTEEVEAAFHALGTSSQGAGGDGGDEGAKSIPIKAGVMGLLAAAQDKIRTDATLAEASVQRKAEVLQAQRSLQQVMIDFQQEEELEAAEEEKKRLANTVKTVEDYKAIVQAKRRAEAEAAAAAGASKTVGQEGDPLLARLAVLDGTAEQESAAVE